MHQVQPLSGEHPEVLVVEDNPVNQSVAEHMLKKLERIQIQIDKCN